MKVHHIVLITGKDAKCFELACGQRFYTYVDRREVLMASPRKMAFNWRGIKKERRCRKCVRAIAQQAAVKGD